MTSKGVEGALLVKNDLALASGVNVDLSSKAKSQYLAHLCMKKSHGKIEFRSA
jgi:hypothetical protein